MKKRTYIVKQEKGSDVWSVAYRVELDMGKTKQGNATYYSVYAEFYKYEEV